MWGKDFSPLISRTRFLGVPTSTERGRISGPNQRKTRKRTGISSSRKLGAILYDFRKTQKSPKTSPTTKQADTAPLKRRFTPLERSFSREVAARGLKTQLLTPTYMLLIPKNLKPRDTRDEYEPADTHSFLTFGGTYKNPPTGQIGKYFFARTVPTAPPVPYRRETTAIVERKPELGLSLHRE